MLAGAEDPTQDVSVRIEASSNEDGTTSLAFHQFLNGEWLETPITQWNATVPNLGAEFPIWTSESFDLIVAVPLPEFGLPASTLEPPEMPADWERPKERSGVLWGFDYSYDPADGYAQVSKRMKLIDGRSPTSNTENIVSFYMICSSSLRQAVLLTDVPPTVDGYEIAWWIDGDRPRAAQWNGRDIQNNDFFAADAPFASGMIEELRDGHNLYVTIWGENSWRTAKLDISNLFKTHAQEGIDYCGQEVVVSPEGMS